MTEFVIVLLVVVVIAVAIYVMARPRGSRPVPAVTERPGSAGQAEVTLPVDDADPDTPATKRLVSETAHRVLARRPEVEEVVVLSRGGRVLGRVARHATSPTMPLAEVPLALHEPHAPRHAGPREPVGTERVVHAPAHVRFRDERPLPHRSLADHFDLPQHVKTRLSDEEDPVAIVRAILEEPPAPVGTDDDLFDRGDRVLMVLRTPLYASVEAATLNAAFLRFQRTGAKHGVVLTAGALHVSDIRRREALAPELLHAGPEGIQRMADAAAVGADPWDFVVPSGYFDS